MSKPSRREFLTAAAASAAGLAIPAVSVASTRPPLGTAKSCIFINMVGGPAHIDTFDPKPDAPLAIRGPFKPIKTKVPGLHLSELFPKLAGMTNKFSLIRSMHHTAPPIHEAGFQLLNTGRLFRDGPEWPNAGAVAGYLLGPRAQGPWPGLWGMISPGPICTGISVGHGLTPAWLSGHFPRGTDWVYGSSEPPSELRLLMGALEGVLLGYRCLTVNTYSTVFDTPSWDCHADGGSLRTDLNDIRDTVAPSFDAAFEALITGLEDRGLLDTTLVIATGEFGRTPLLNGNGGRDHWAGAWTALVAGGGTQGGRIIGRTDAKGTEPTDRPVTPQELVATIFHALGIPYDATIPGPDRKPVAVYPGTPVRELF